MAKKPKEYRVVYEREGRTVRYRDGSFSCFEGNAEAANDHAWRENTIDPSKRAYRDMTRARLESRPLGGTKDEWQEEAVTEPVTP